MDPRSRLTHSRVPYLAALEEHSEGVESAPQESAYFSPSTQHLDPRLFNGDRLRPDVAMSLTQPLDEFFQNQGYQQPQWWMEPYLAGSGVSFNWSGHRTGGDLDVLIDVNFQVFRRTVGVTWTDRDISEMLNERLKDTLWPEMENWNGFEVTYYVNPCPLRDIQPYAAVSLSSGNWLVYPSHKEPMARESYVNAAKYDESVAGDILNRYHTARRAVQDYDPDHPHRVTALSQMSHALEEGANLFEEVHRDRSIAFSRQGKGWQDWHNYRWQAGKKAGWLPAFAQMHRARASARESVGMVHTSPHRLITRAIQAQR